MSKDKSFPARTVLVSFQSCEEMLVNVLRIVPWCEKHEKVWSPALTTVIMEACTQLDSLWGYTAWLSRFVREQRKRNELTIKDYHGYFADRSHSPLGDRWVVFWGSDPIRIWPFEKWQGTKDYVPLPWWGAYNKLKHDRLANQEMGTLSAAVHATAGLFLAILQCEHCRYAVEAAGWLSASDAVSHNPKACLGEDSGSAKDVYVLAESRLFSYPVGWSKATVKPNDDWQGNASFRFKHWFQDFATD